MDIFLKPKQSFVMFPDLIQYFSKIIINLLNFMLIT